MGLREHKRGNISLFLLTVDKLKLSTYQITIISGLNSYSGRVEVFLTKEESS